MDWTAPIDIYCERLGPGFWAEPINAVTNLSFIAAAIWAWVEARQRAEPNRLVWVLIALAFAIGVGSFLFHTLANRWSGLADVLPIWTFVALYILIGLNRLGGIRPGRIALGVVALVGVITIWRAMGEGSPPQDAAPSGPDPFNGSLQYLPAVIAFAVFSVLTQVQRHPLRWLVLGAGVTFLVSLTARTLDRDICASLPLGTHFLWHLLNGLVIGLVLQILIRARDARTDVAGRV
ncbi:ceramidase [Paracoccus sp. TK19116]|uniref:Ceramidase n=1 Tax=Paracoccus albicereus TaxID=2922394 RepID=A0ABT1MVB8_9RHOB|nr:ceramidase domain-containing protein [Paracoccus albicereus]MCQ0970801.1 ceramidase [Paracoccus albicereus]